MNLDRLFNQAADKVGTCPLPDPETKGIKTIHHPKLMRVKKQPLNYNYDNEVVEADDLRFHQEIARMVKDGEITENEAINLLNKVDN